MYASLLAGLLQASTAHQQGEPTRGVIVETEPWFNMESAWVQVLMGEGGMRLSCLLGVHVCELRKALRPSPAPACEGDIQSCVLRKFSRRIPAPAHEGDIQSCVLSKVLRSSLALAHEGDAESCVLRKFLRRSPALAHEGDAESSVCSANS